MRSHEIILERAPAITDAERVSLIKFMIDWLNGTFMTSPRASVVRNWERINELFPARPNRPLRLMRLVTLPISFADQKEFDLHKPAPLGVGSWTSTHFGLESVHGIATEIKQGPRSCRMAIQATIAPADIIATPQSMKRAFASLTHDYDFDNHYTEVRTKTDRGTVVKTVFKPYLGNDDETFHYNIGDFNGQFADTAGGPMRQYEYIVRTTPLRVRNIRVYRKGDEEMFGGHDDPLNSGSSRGWFKD